MLLVQDICLSWGKKERSSACAKVRAEFPIVYLLDKLPNMFYGGVMLHRLDFWQRETTFRASHINDADCFQFYNSVQDLNISSLSIQPDAGKYKVTFFYDKHNSGRPSRHGHNKDYYNINSLLYHYDILNETAFSLGQGQYGRIIWNERKTDYDTGEWYYRCHTINLLHYLDKMPETDIFLTCKLDFEYKQMAILY